jgi:ABC-type uncharacterized transport system permease subunit
VSAAVAYTTQNPGTAWRPAWPCRPRWPCCRAFVSITQKGNQLVGGIAINIAMSGLTFVLAQFFYQQGGRTPDLGDARLFDIVLPGTAALAGVPFLGWFYGHVIGGHSALVYLAFALVPLVHWVMYHSRFGLRLRACGENPHAADAAGVSVERPATWRCWWPAYCARSRAPTWRSSRAASSCATCRPAPATWR